MPFMELYATLFGAAYLSDTVFELILEQVGFFFHGVSFPNNW
jgi:hypothetical protein